MARTRVCIADDHALFRDGLVSLINRQPDMEVVGVAGDGLEMLSLARESDIDIILMDVMMPISDGIESTRLIREYNENVLILMLTAQDDEEKLIDAIQAGANGYLLKSASSEGLLRAVRGALAGEFSLPRHLTAGMLRGLMDASDGGLGADRPAGLSTTLTHREIRVLELIDHDASNQQIADQLGISLHTAKSHVRNIIGKLGARNRWEAVRIAREMGILRN